MPYFAGAAPENGGPVVVVEIEGMITAGQLSYLRRQTASCGKGRGAIVCPNLGYARGVS